MPPKEIPFREKKKMSRQGPYHKKMTKHLLTSGSYRNIKKNPSNKILKEIKNTINISSLNDYWKNKLIPSGVTIPQIYGLHKIHKEVPPLRLIVNTIGSPTYTLAKYLVKALTPLVGHTSSFIKESKYFVDNIKYIKLE